MTNPLEPVVRPITVGVAASRRALARRISRGYRSIVSGDPDGQPEWIADISAGDDEGYFGPGSSVWAVHANLATLVGGVRALLMQALHPGAVTGVDQHSGYRSDPLARLAGTTRWLTVTTFGSRAAADREAARVRGMHRRVQGVYRTAQGETATYRAGDDALLAWVHAAFTDSFLTAYEVFTGPVPGGADRYVNEWATAARLVGVNDPPRTAADLRAQIRAYSPDLAANDATARTLSFLRQPPLPPPARVGYAVLFAGAASTLDPAHRDLLGLPDYGVRVPRTATSLLLRGLGTALGGSPPPAAAARRRLERIGQARADATGSAEDAVHVAPAP